MDYQTGFTVLQIVFTLTVGWFIRLLMKFSKDLKVMDKQVKKNASDHEMCKAIRVEKETTILATLRRIESMVGSITVLTVKDNK